MDSRPLIPLEGSNASAEWDEEHMSDEDLKRTLRPENRTFKWLSRLQSRRRALLIGVAIVVIPYLIYLMVRPSQPLKPSAAAKSRPFSRLFSRPRPPVRRPQLEILSPSAAELCQFCNCDASPAFYDPTGMYSHLPSRPLLEDIHSQNGDVDVNEFLRLTMLDMFCARQRLPLDQALRIVQTAAKQLNDTMTWMLGNLEPRRPTIYILTSTWPNSKSGAGRPQHLRRHGRTIQTFLAQQAMSQNEKPWQLAWLLTEDNTFIDHAVTQVLRRSGVPHIYFTYGRTNSWANPQKNAGIAMAYALSRPAGRGLYGSGPVLGVDDDNKVLPNVFRLITTVRRVGVFPVGNFPRDGAWENPIVDKNGIVTGTDSQWQRKFSFDYGGFTYNTTVLGTIVGGPTFFKYENPGGESEFIAQIVDKIQDVEPLCGISQEHCHMSWHNQPLTDLEKMTDKEEIDYIRTGGPEALLRVCFGDVSIKGAKPEFADNFRQLLENFKTAVTTERIDRLLSQEEDFCSLLYRSPESKELLTIDVME